MKIINILIIEDNLELLENTAELLVLNGYTVLTADSGEQGINIAKEKRPALILCDIAMPFMDGYTVLDSIRNTPETKDIPFIYLTAKSEKKEVSDGMARGADAYLTKPFVLEDLLKAIKEYCRQTAY